MNLSNKLASNFCTLERFDSAYVQQFLAFFTPGIRINCEFSNKQKTVTKKMSVSNMDCVEALRFYIQKIVAVPGVKVLLLDDATVRIFGQ